MAGLGDCPVILLWGYHIQVEFRIKLVNEIGYI